MKKLIFAAALAVVFGSTAFAQTPAAAPGAKPAATAAAAPGSSNCEARALSKSGKPLTGAAKTSFMKKCEGGTSQTATATCETKAVAKNGKPLAGAAKTAFMKKCEANAGK